MTVTLNGASKRLDQMEVNQLAPIAKEWAALNDAIAMAIVNEIKSEKEADTLYKIFDGQRSAPAEWQAALNEMTCPPPPAWGAAEIELYNRLAATPAIREAITNEADFRKSLDGRLTPEQETMVNKILGRLGFDA